MVTLKRILRHGFTLVATVLLGGFLSATLVRFAPGFDVDEQQLDPRYSAASIQTLHDVRLRQHNICAFYIHYLVRALHGDLGGSLSLGQPVNVLLRQRAPLTLRLLAGGLGLAWTAAFGLACGGAWFQTSTYDSFATVVSGALLCLPAAVLALLSVLWNLPGALVIALIIFPRIYRYFWNLLSSTYSLPHIVTARSKGLGNGRILFWHIIPVVRRQLLAIGGVSVSMAAGAAIPVEALCGFAGIGQLAWQAALARDLPLLVNITILVTLLTLVANSAADILGHGFRNREA